MSKIIGAVITFTAHRCHQCGSETLIPAGATLTEIVGRGRNRLRHGRAADLSTLPPSLPRTRLILTGDDWPYCGHCINDLADAPAPGQYRLWPEPAEPEGPPAVEAEPPPATPGPQITLDDILNLDERENL